MTEPAPTTVDDIWTTDARVLAAIVQSTEIDGDGDSEVADTDAIFLRLGLDERQGDLSVRRLVSNGLVYEGEGRTFGSGRWHIGGATEEGLRKVGAWPEDSELLADRLIAGLAQAAATELNPIKRERLEKAATGVAAGREEIAEVLAAFLPTSGR